MSELSILIAIVLWGFWRYVATIRSPRYLENKTSCSEERALDHLFARRGPFERATPLFNRISGTFVPCRRIVLKQSSPSLLEMMATRLCYYPAGDNQVTSRVAKGGYISGLHTPP